MLRSRFLVLIVSISLIFSMWACSEKKIPELPQEKIPITTNSVDALKAFEQGRNAVDRFQMEEALSYFQRAVELDPDFALAWLQLAYAEKEVDLFLAAIDSAKAHAEAVSDGERLIIKAAEYGLVQNNMKQRATLNQLVARYPGDEMVHLLLGNYYFRIQQYKLAIKSYTNAIVINKNMMTPYNQLGYSQRALGNYGEAEKAFKFYLRLNPENPNAYDSYAELLMEMGRYEESIELYQKALAIDPKFLSSHIGISCNYSFLGKPDAARAQLQVLKSDAENAKSTRSAIFTEALSYVYEGDLDQALTTMRVNLDQAERDNNYSGLVKDLAIIGNLYLELGKPDQALSNYNRAIKVVNDSNLQEEIIKNAQTAHLYNISRVFAAQGDFKRAEQVAKNFYEEALETKNPVLVWQAFQLNGIVALAQKDYQLAVDQFKQADQLDPMNLYQLGLAYKGLGQEEDAEIMIQRASELNILNNLNQALVLSKTKFKPEA